MLDFKLEDDVCIITFTHYLNTNICHQIEPILLKKLKEIEYSKIIFDLDRVEYIASAFIRICLIVAENVGYENFSIINTMPFIKKVFKMAGLDKKLQVE